MLAHRSGVQQGSTFESRYWNTVAQQPGTISQIRRWVSDTVLQDAPEVTPGTHLYANQGYTVAATMMELATGKDWETLVAEEIFSPARMRGAGFGQVCNGLIPPTTPWGHDLAAGASTPVPRPIMNASLHKGYQASTGPGGAIACTLRDWAMLLHVHMTSDISNYLTPASGTRLQQPFVGTTGYGRGISAVSRSWANPGMALNHAGDIFGAGTVVWAAPAKDFFAIVHTNCRSADNAVGLALDDVAGLLIGRYTDGVPAGPLLEEPAALPLRRSGNGFAFDFYTLPGLRYLVETGPSFAAWSPANGAAGQSATSLTTTFNDPTPAALQKFYRARVAP
jgi:CubicO group peptidase (beta-lactamase class C family)